MDILNFINWKRSKRQVTSAPPNSFIPLGIPDGKRDDDYLAVNISAADFAASVSTAGPQGPQGPPGPQGPVGSVGSQGVQGIQGQQGLQGPAGAIGPAGLNWQGSWSALGVYAADDAVGFGGASYFCVNAVGPSVSDPTVDTVNWALLANIGATGPQGIPGVAGPAGAAGATGPAGPQGAQGIQGIQGIQGVPGPVGPAGLNWQGVWSNLGTYVVDDAVGYNGASWFCINPVGPSILAPDLDPTNWALLAAEGAQGPQGLTGAAGAQGVAGPQGIPGPNQITIDTTDILNGGSRRVLFQSVAGKVSEDARYTYNPANGNLNSTGLANTATNSAFGSNALQSSTTGQFLSAFGLGALQNNSSGGNNTAVGSYSLNVNNSNNNTAVGYFALSNSNAVDNTAVGYAAGAVVTIGKWNAAIGSQTMAIGTNSSTKSVAVGYKALYSATSNSVAVGFEALMSNLAIETVAVGESALRANTTGTLNTGVGFNALKLNTTGLGNTALGYKALGSNVLGNSNTAVGSGALFLNIGDGNTAVGTYALQNNTSGLQNTAVGYNSLPNNQNGSNNIAIGVAALASNLTANSNIGIGDNALQISDGSGNIAIGVNAAADNTTGASNIIIGANTTTQDFNGSVIIGTGAQATANNQFVIGTNSDPVGTVTASVPTPDNQWLVRINEKNYLIPMEYVP